MPPAITVAIIAVSISSLSLLISLSIYLNVRKTRKNSENLETTQYRLKLAAAIKLEKPKEHNLIGSLKLSNAGEKHVTLSGISVLGKAQADIGDTYSVSSSDLIPKGAIVLKSGESLDLPLKFIVGIGNLIALHPCVFLEGHDSKGNYFSEIIRIKSCAP